MPIQRIGTPPTSKVKEERSVLNTLSAWTDDGEDEPSTAKTPLLERQVSTKDRVIMAMDSESDNFHLVIGVVIFANAIVIGLETEFGRSHFIIVENVFNAIFFTEMCLRMRQWGCAAYFQDLWNIFDFTLVMIGTLDLWILPHIVSEPDAASHGHKQVGYQFSVLRLLRILRLLRVLRVVRLFRMFHQLFLIMQAFNKAFQIVLLIGILVAILDYACAIILTQGIGHNAVSWGDDEALLKEWFGTIPNSMQTLFLLMTLTGWGEIATKLTDVIPGMVVYPIIALYIMITSYTMISLITGIISESLITSQQEYRRKRLIIMDGKRRDLHAELRGFLYEMHEDEKDELGCVEAEDLKTSVRGDNELLNKLADIGINIDEGGILGLIDKLSMEGARRINMDYFVDKLTNLQGFANASAVIDLKYELLRIQTTIHNIACKTWPNDPPLLTPKPPAQEEGPRRTSQMYADTNMSKKSSLRAEPSGSENGAPPKAKRASGVVNFSEQ